MSTDATQAAWGRKVASPPEELSRRGVPGTEVPMTVAGQRNYGEIQVPPLCGLEPLGMAVAGGDELALRLEHAACLRERLARGVDQAHHVRRSGAGQPKPLLDLGQWWPTYCVYETHESCA
jgi:hypothetical protein